MIDIRGSKRHRKAIRPDHRCNLDASRKMNAAWSRCAKATMILLKMIPGRMAGIGFDPVQVPRFANVEAPTLLRFVNDCCARRKNSSTKNVRSWRRTMCALWKLIGFAARRQDVQSRRTSSRPSTLPSKRLCYLKSKRRERRLRPHSKHQWGLPRTPTLRANSRPPTLGEIAKKKTYQREIPGVASLRTRQSATFSVQSHLSLDAGSVVLRY